LDAADITVRGGAKGSFTGSGTDYSLIITPESLTDAGTITVDVDADVAQDGGANKNVAADQFKIGYDGSKPTVTLASASAQLINAPFTVTFTFTEAMTGLTGGEITVINGTASAFTPVSATEYTALISPMAAGEVQVSLAATVANDPAGNGNQPSPVLSRTFDNLAPAGYAVAFNQSRIDASNQANASVKVTGAEAGSAFFYTISSSNGGPDVTGTANAAAAGFDIGALNLTALNDGQLTVSFYQQDAVGNKGAAVTATVTKVG
jgi:hypothetical protein